MWILAGSANPNPEIAEDAGHELFGTGTMHSKNRARLSCCRYTVVSASFDGFEDIPVEWQPRMKIILIELLALSPKKVELRIVCNASDCNILLRYCEENLEYDLHELYRFYYKHAAYCLDVILNTMDSKDKNGQEIPCLIFRFNVRTKTPRIAEQTYYAGYQEPRYDHFINNKRGKKRRWPDDDDPAMRFWQVLDDEIEWNDSSGSSYCKVVAKVGTGLKRVTTHKAKIHHHKFSIVKIYPPFLQNCKKFGVTLTLEKDDGCGYLQIKTA